MSIRMLCLLCMVVSALCLAAPSAAAEAMAAVPQYGVYEISFTGRHYGVKDDPVKTVTLETEWRHEGGGTVRVWGFYDGDGRGGADGSVFKVRFCPTQTGTWTLAKVECSDPAVGTQHAGLQVSCVASKHAGFWMPDAATGNRWYRRSDGTHPYIVGDTFYTFLSQYTAHGPTKSNIHDDIVNVSHYFDKLRFTVMGGTYVNPKAKPFLDAGGTPTDDGNYACRPNASWFHERVDMAVQTAYEQDLIADLILCGPDTKLSRATLKAGKNGGDSEPYLRYIAARYGSYPNVWLCLCNEYDIKWPGYTPAQIAQFGATLRKYLPYPTPMSVHASPKDWDKRLNARPWHDHVILQCKLKSLTEAADWVSRNHVLGGNVPVIDDELAYEGAGDGWSEGDVLEAFTGAFAGGGYASTGCKPGSKQGQYFWGDFSAAEHTSADNLRWLRQQAEAMTFWKLQPMANEHGAAGPFSGLAAGFRVLGDAGQEFVLASNQRTTCHVRLDGQWQMQTLDVLTMQASPARAMTGDVTFETPESRAALCWFSKAK